MVATQKQVTRQKRQWAEALAQGKPFTPKGAWLFDPAVEEARMKESQQKREIAKMHETILRMERDLISIKKVLVRKGSLVPTRYRISPLKENYVVQYVNII